MTSRKRTYSSLDITLCNNTTWHLNCHNEAMQQWMQTLAHITGLGPEQPNAIPLTRTYHDNQYTLPFTHQVDGNKISISCLPFTAWQKEFLAMKHALYPLYRAVIADGGQLCHGALIEHQGKGVILAAKGGTGKSTSCKRLPSTWKAHADDELLLLPVGNGEYRAHPLPTWSEFYGDWSHNTWNIQVSVPVHGIFFLEQATQDKANRIQNGEAAALLTESSRQAYGDNYTQLFEQDNKPQLLADLFRNSCNAVQHLPAFRLQQTLHGEFWKHIANALAW